MKQAVRQPEGNARRAPLKTERLRATHERCPGAAKMPGAGSKSRTAQRPSDGTTGAALAEGIAKTVKEVSAGAGRWWKRGRAQLAERFPAFVENCAARLRPWAGSLGWLALSMLAGATVLPGEIAPFGLALCAAAPQPLALVCCAGCVLGGFWGLPAALAVGQAAAALLTGALRLVLGRNNAFWACAAGVVVNSMLSQMAAALGQPQAGPLRWLVQGCLVLALTIVYREVRSGWLSMTRRNLAVRLAMWTSLACALASLPQPDDVPVWLLCGMGLAGLVLGWLERPGRLLLVWCAGALGCLLMQVDAGVLLTVLCAVWLAARFAGRRGVMAAVYFGTGFLGLLAVWRAQSLGWLLLTNGATAVLFLLLSERLLLRLDERLEGEDAGDPLTPVRRLQALAGGLEAIGNGVEAAGGRTENAEDPNAPVEAACRQVCGGCTQKARCWGAGYDDTQHAMQSFLEKWRTEYGAEFPSWFLCTRKSALRTALLRGENLRVLRRAGQAGSGVLRRAVSDQYRAVAAGLYRMAAEWRPEIPQPQLADRIRAVTDALQLPVRELSAARRADDLPEVCITLRPVRLGDSVLRELSAGISRCCGRRMAATVIGRPEDGQELRFAPPPVCRVAVGMAQSALSGACGDVVEQLQHDGIGHVLLCDGMGTGSAAATDARMTALFVARLLRAGMDCDVAARLVNAALLTREPGDRGSTLDALSINGMDGGARLYKAGACPTYLVRGGEVRRLGGEGSAFPGLPLGSAEAVQGTRLELSLQPGDLLAMVSDGVLTCGEKTLLRELQALRHGALQPMAKALLTVCAGAPPEDDCTVVLLRVERPAEQEST